MLIKKIKTLIGSFAIAALLIANFTVLAPTETKAVVAAPTVKCNCAFWGGNKMCLSSNGGATCKVTTPEDQDCQLLNSNCGGVNPPKTIE